MPAAAFSLPLLLRYVLPRHYADYAAMPAADDAAAALALRFDDDAAADAIDFDAAAAVTLTIPLATLPAALLPPR